MTEDEVRTAATGTSHTTRRTTVARFNAWLAEERAKAWDEGAAVPRMVDGSDMPARDNPYRKATA